MKQQLLASAMALAITAPASALPLLDLEAGVGTWLGSYDGYLISESFDVDNTLGLNDGASSPTHAYVEFRHPLLLLPNFRAAYTKVTTSGNVDSNITIGDTTFNSNTNLDLDLTHFDANLFYELDFFPFLAMQAGVGARVFQGGLEAVNNDAAQQESLDFSGVPLPMLSLGARFDVPLTDFYVRGRADGLAYGDSRLLDWSVGAGYELGLPMVMGVKLEAGWRQWALKLDPNDFDADGFSESIDTTLSGAYLSAGVTF